MIKATWKKIIVKACEECDEEIEDVECDECGEELLPVGIDEFFCVDSVHICLECAEKKARDV